jgi:subtilase family serine protease
MPGWNKVLGAYPAAASGNQGSITMRNVPDVAMTADNVYVRCDGADWNLAGTSCAAPLWAAVAALVNQQAQAAGGPPVGFLNPAIYAVGTSAAYNSCFHDTVTGNNFSPSSPSQFSAVTGYDLCTGWGTPSGSALINALSGTSAAPAPIPPAPASLGANAGFNAVALLWNGSVGAASYNIYRGTSAGAETLVATGVTTINYMQLCGRQPSTRRCLIAR